MTAMQRLGLHPSSLAQGPLDPTDPLSSDPAASRRQRVAGIDLSAGQGQAAPVPLSTPHADHRVAAGPVVPGTGPAPSFTTTPPGGEDGHDSPSPVVAAMPVRAGTPSPPGVPAHRQTTETLTIESTDTDENDTVHLTCDICDPHGLRALCGTQLPSEDWEDGDDEPTCVVCADLESAPCPYCGAA